MKKLFSVLLTITLLLLSCGALAEGSDIVTPTSVIAFPLEQPVTLRIMVNRTTEDSSALFNSRPQNEYLEQLTNVHIEWICVPGSAWNEQKSLVFASGEYPDAMIDENLTDLDVMANVDALINIADYLNVMPNMSAAFEKFSELKALTTSPDGGIYTLGQRRPLADTPQMICINKTWLDNVGKDIPTTTDELIDVLRAFRDEDPNGNGEADEVPLTFAINGAVTGWAPLFGSFGIIDYSSPKTPLSKHVNVENGKVVYVPIDERYIDAIEFFHQLYNEGLIDRDVFTDPQIAAKRSNNQIGMQLNWSLEGLDSGNNCEWVAMMPLVGPSGEKPIYTKNNAATYRRNMAICFNTCENPEILMAWFDLFYSEDIGIQSYYGPYGFVLQKNSDGTRVYLDPPENTSIDALKWLTSLADDTPTAIYPEWHDTVEVNDYLKFKQENNAALKEYQPAEIYPNVIYTEEQLDQLDVLLTDIDSYVERMQANWVVNGGIRDEWDGYLQRLDNMGLQKLIDIYQDALDTYYQ